MFSPVSSSRSRFSSRRSIRSMARLRSTSLARCSSSSSLRVTLTCRATSASAARRMASAFLRAPAASTARRSSRACSCSYSILRRLRSADSKRTASCSCLPDSCKCIRSRADLERDSCASDFSRIAAAAAAASVDSSVWRNSALTSLMRVLLLFTSSLASTSALAANNLSCFAAAVRAASAARACRCRSRFSWRSSSLTPRSTARSSATRCSLPDAAALRCVNSATLATRSPSRSSASRSRWYRTDSSFASCEASRSSYLRTSISARCLEARASASILALRSRCACSSAIRSPTEPRPPASARPGEPPTFPRSRLSAAAKAMSQSSSSTSLSLTCRLAS
mmetsp:Transcript_11734/g.29720  ORF Transcript_11734/g.29720 Transcript_11734/m.29720 type:complete len:339 (-) Transcript_11734:270-1286(-)